MGGLLLRYYIQMKVSLNFESVRHRSSRLEVKDLSAICFLWSERRAELWEIRWVEIRISHRNRSLPFESLSFVVLQVHGFNRRE